MVEVQYIYILFGIYSLQTSKIYLKVVLVAWHLKIFMGSIFNKFLDLGQVPKQNHIFISLQPAKAAKTLQKQALKSYDLMRNKFVALLKFNFIK